MSDPFQASNGVLGCSHSAVALLTFGVLQERGTCLCFDSPWDFDVFVYFMFTFILLSTSARITIKCFQGFLLINFFLDFLLLFANFGSLANFVHNLAHVFETYEVHILAHVFATYEDTLRERSGAVFHVQQCQRSFVATHVQHVAITESNVDNGHGGILSPGCED